MEYNINLRTMINVGKVHQQPANDCDTISNRDVVLDGIKGFLILLVVLGHSGVKYAVYIYWFHMPIFFIIGGYVLSNNITIKEYVLKYFPRLLIPYTIYGLIDSVFNRNSIKSYISILYGGRNTAGIYWYVTCYLMSIVIFLFLKKRFGKKSIIIILIGGGIGILESRAIKNFSLLIKPGILWNIDVCLIAVLYVAIGYFGKKYIHNLFHNNNKKYDLLAFCNILILVLYIIICKFCNMPLFVLDMKNVVYSGLLSTILIPLLFLVIISRSVLFFQKNNYISHVLSYFGRISVPIMYTHTIVCGVINRFIKINVFEYVVIGILFPVIIVELLKYKKIKKFFGVPVI